MKKTSRFDNVNITNYIVFIVITAVFVVNAVVLYQYFANGIEVPTELVIGFNGFCGVELLGMAFISGTKNKYKGEDNYE